jgi:Na+/H+ antiporter NhaD/arsenite permease-like protein
VNDTVCVAFTPLVIELAAVRRHRPLPYLLALATASNIGSVATIVGNPQNMLIGSVSGVGGVRFTTALAPIALAGLALDAAVLWLLFRGELAPHADDRRVLTDHRTAPRRPVTLAGVARTIDWRLLVLFVGLFVVVGAATRAGIDRDLFALLRPLGLQTVAGLAATAVVLSNAISNVPAVMLFTPVVPKLADPRRAWLALAMASTLAGNLTIVGSIANLIVAEGARRRGVEVSFGDYVRVGLPITALTLAFGVWWLASIRQ